MRNHLLIQHPEDDASRILGLFNSPSDAIESLYRTLRPKWTIVLNAPSEDYPNRVHLCIQGPTEIGDCQVFLTIESIDKDAPISEEMLYRDVDFDAQRKRNRKAKEGMRT